MQRRVNLWLLNILLLGLLQGCGGCGEDKPPPVSSMRDAQVDEDDADVPFDAGPRPIDVPDPNDLFPGEPPEELEGESCAAHTNKIYELTTSTTIAQSAQLSVDLLASRFGMAFVSDEDVMCSSGVSFAELYGTPGQIEAASMIAYDDCTLVEVATIARGDGAWLLGIVDNRMETRDLWVHAFDPESGDTIATHRITENMAGEGTVEILSLGRERAVIVWTETAFDGSGTSLLAQFLSGEGEPTGDVVEIEPAGTAFYAGLSMAVLNNCANDDDDPCDFDGDLGVAAEDYIALAYRRDDEGGISSIVVDILSFETAERDRDPWVLTTEAGANGTAEIAADRSGAGVAYSVTQSTSRQVWFQALGLDGRAAPVMSSVNMGGPIEPNRLVGPPHSGVDVSVAKTPTGFIVAYRALPSVGIDEPQIRAYFLDRRGQVLGDSGIALAAMTGGQTAIESAFDGRQALSWSDTDDEDGTTTLRALILPCSR